MNKHDFLFFRVNLFGYSSKQQFEELFMSLLVLINREGDPEIMSKFMSRFVSTPQLHFTTVLIS